MYSTCMYTCVYSIYSMLTFIFDSVDDDMYVKKQCTRIYKIYHLYISGCFSVRVFGTI